MKKILFALLLANCTYAEALTLVGHVVGVADGDTITVLDATKTQHKIRLSGIDAVEKKQAFGQVSKKSLSDIVFDKVVTIEYEKEDQYGRLLGKVLYNGNDVNLEQVKKGMAWFYRKYQGELSQEDRISYLRAEEYASSHHLGLWSDENPTPPWDFRKNEKNNNN